MDKTLFIKEWWDKGDSVTVIMRPYRFGKTLTMSMVEQFFSGGLKDNAHLAYGFLTGILRVAKESIFSGLNKSESLKWKSLLYNFFA